MMGNFPRSWTIRIISAILLRTTGKTHDLDVDVDNPGEDEHEVGIVAMDEGVDAVESLSRVLAPDGLDDELESSTVALFESAPKLRNIPLDHGQFRAKTAVTAALLGDADCHAVAEAQNFLKGEIVGYLHAAVRTRHGRR